MFQEKIIIAPSFEARVGFRAKGLECVCTGSMEVGGILFKTVVRREIHATTKPPNRLFARAFDGLGHKEPDVQMHGWDVGVAGMQNQRNPHGFPMSPDQLRPRGRSRGGEARPGNIRKPNAAALEQRTTLENARQSATAGQCRLFRWL